MSGHYRWHKDWRVWTATVVMLIAIVMYVLTLDDSSTILVK